MANTFNFKDLSDPIYTVMGCNSFRLIKLCRNILKESAKSIQGQGFAHHTKARPVEAAVKATTKAIELAIPYITPEKVKMMKVKGADNPADILTKDVGSDILRKHMKALGTKNIEETCRQADIIVAAIGRPEIVRSDWVKPGATIIDVGINRTPAPERGPDKHKIVGDVDFQDCEPIAKAITPVPGGVGPMTIACLLANTVTACCRINNIEPPKELMA